MTSTTGKRVAPAHYVTVLVAVAHLKARYGEKIVSESWFRKRVTTGEVPCLRRGRVVLFDLEQLDAWVERGFTES